MLTENEIERLRQAIIATIASPMIGSIEDYTWEAIFHYVKDITLSDPALGRSKLLYDAVDTQIATGWSFKSLQLKNFMATNTFSFVIQRADIIKKAEELGFPGLAEKSSPDELRAAIIQHWNDKIISSKSEQGVVNSYEGILLKTIEGCEYVYCEFSLDTLDASSLISALISARSMFLNNFCGNCFSHRNNFWRPLNRVVFPTPLLPLNITKCRVS